VSRHPDAAALQAALALWLIAAAARAEDDTPARAADRVLAASDAAALVALAAREQPDPWLVADELCARGSFDRAEEFARAARGADVEGLPAWVASERASPTGPLPRAVIATVNAALAKQEGAAALAALDQAPAAPEGVAAVRLRFARGHALRMTGRDGESGVCFVAAAEAAERLGWLARASAGFHEAGARARDKADWRAASFAWRRKLEIDDRRGNRRALAESLLCVGNVARLLGDNPGALVAQQRALRLAAELGDRSLVAMAEGNLGLVHLDLGNYAEALDCLERSLIALDELGDRGAVALTLGNIGSVHERLEDFRKALEYQQRAFRLMEEVGDRMAAARTLSAIGNIHLGLGDDAKALEFFERALRSHELLGDIAGIAALLGNIGQVYMRRGDGERALRSQEQALRLREELGDRTQVAQTLVNLGVVHRGLRDPDRALGFYARGAEEARQIGARDVLARALWGEAVARADLGRAREAIAPAREAVRLASQLSAGLADEQGARARGGFASVFDLGALAAASCDDAGELAFFLESGRAGSLLEGLRNRDALLAVAVPEALRAADVEARATEAAAAERLRAAVAKGDRAAIRALRAEVEGAQARVADVIARIQRSGKLASVVYPEADSLDTIRGRLREGEALVLYGVFDERALALVVTRGAARIASLGATRDLVTAAAALTADQVGTDTTQAVANLRTLVIEPLALVDGTTRLLLSPDGVLSHLPFALLAPERDLCCIPSGTTLGHLLEEAAGGGDGVLALGDPDYGATPAPATRSGSLRGGERLVRLPATADEAKAVGDVVLIGREATEAALRDALAKRSRWRALHLACHGLADPARPLFSSLALTPAGEDDGFLTALDVLRMRVPADLVVLSACETGKGTHYKAEGLLGLTRAFMLAGAPRVLVSLWRVDDEATGVLMARFHEAWKRGVPAARALREAQAFVRAQQRWSHPAYWAAWALWGLPE